MAGSFELAMGNLGSSFDKLLDTLRVALSAVGYTYEDYQMRKWIESLDSRAYIDDGYAYLIVLDKEKPSRSRLIRERLK